jgi:hypothetical protein
MKRAKPNQIAGAYFFQAMDYLIGWQPKSEVVLEFGKQYYNAVLDELQRLSGNPWVDLPQARWQEYAAGDRPQHSYKRRSLTVPIAVSPGRSGVA